MLEDRHIDEYRSLFDFFFLYRAAALLIALGLMIVPRALTPITAAAWFFFCAYTLFLFLNRGRIFALVVKKPLLHAVDIAISGLGLVVAYNPGNIFYFYALAPLMPVATMRGLVGATLAALCYGGFVGVSVLVHGLPNETVTAGVVTIFYQIAAFFVLGYMITFPAKLIETIAAQGRVIQAHAEKEATLRERNRLAGEFHDNLGQIFGGIKLRAESLFIFTKSKDAKDEARRIATFATEGVHAVRSALFFLKEETFRKSLAEVFTSYCERLSDTFGFVVRTDFGEEPDLPQETKAQVFRIGQEALNNAQKHSGKSTAALSLGTDDGHLALNISDKGSGFLPADIDMGLGLNNMKDRAESIGARLRIASQPNKGTEVTLLFPLTEIGGTADGPH